MREGDKVVWESQAAGSRTRKSGTVIKEISAGESAKIHLSDSIKKSHIKFGVDCSVCDRVLVAVPAGKDGRITHYYCPRKSALVTQGM